jgi:hypothetical protein
MQRNTKTASEIDIKIHILPSFPHLFSTLALSVILLSRLR